MADMEFGPVELILAAFEGDRPNTGVIEAVLGLVEAGTIRLLDLVQVSRGEDGEIGYLEIEDAGLPLADIELAASGLASSEDLNHLADSLPPGTSALLLVVELRWAVHLASRLAESSGFVVDAMRIPAPVVNEVVAAARAAG